MNTNNMTYNRIISLVPSLTELLIDLGLQEKIVGRTRFCVHPEETVENIPIIGGTKNPRVEKILDLNPDFILANKEENRKQDVRVLQDKSSAHVELTDISTIEEALTTIFQLGAQLGVEEKAAHLVQKINAVLAQRPKTDPLRTVYFIWKAPWMTVGGDTYIHDVMGYWRLENIFGGDKRYPAIELNQLEKRNPELILLSSEPYPFREKHVRPVQKACPDARIILVEGQWFSWYGSRMLTAFEQLNHWREAISQESG
ncbi:MAG TPA: helical backbone metal receptor [Balneolaceae bacterium]|nr:helical backbone metal receptor [Balneolaceae bacterium]